MKILKVKFSEEEEDQIFNSLIERFDINNSDIYSRSGQTIDFELNELIDMQATLELYAEGSIDENNQGSLISQCVLKFTYFFTDKEGDEVQAEMINESGKCLDDRISDHYRI